MAQSITSAKIALLAISIGLALNLRARAGSAAETDPPMQTQGWRTGNRFYRQLQMPVGVTWRQTPLRSALNGLSSSQSVAMFLDRRIDPDQEIDFSVDDVKLKTALDRLATDHGFGMSYVGPVVYLGPTGVTAKLATLMELRNEQIARLPSVVRKKWRRRHVWRWSDVTEPRQLMKELAAETGIDILGLEQVPYDLWPAANLPPLSLSQRLTLVAAGFQLTFAISDNGRFVRLVPIPARVSLQRSYDLGRRAADVAEKLSRMLPAAGIRLQGAMLLVDASAEDHQTVRAYFQGYKKPSDTSNRLRKLYTLRVVDKRAEPLLRSLATRFSLKVDIDSGVSQQLTQTVRFHVVNVTLDDLFHAVLRPLGLKHEIRGDVLYVGLENKPPK